MKRFAISSSIVQRVFVDANVLYSRTQRDWLYAFYKASPSLFQLYSTEDVYAETLAHIRDRHPGLSGGQIRFIRKQMQELTEVITEYDCEKESVTFLGADPGDLHVHAAAVEGQCDYLLTDDRKLYGQLSEEELDELPYGVYTADDFFCLIAEASAPILDKALTGQLSYWMEKMDEPPTQEGMLKNAACPRFALLVKRATMRKAGVSPEEINKIAPLDSGYSMQARSVRYLGQITEM